MKIVALSDLHCEFSYPDNIEGDKDAVLVLAGDIFVGTKAFREEYIPKWASMFKYVIYVLGNHEYYRHNIDTLPNKIRNKIKELKLDNVFLLDEDVVELDGIQFVGTTLWTSLNSGNPVAKIVTKFSMNDFNQIRVGAKYRKLDIADWLYMNHSAMLFLESIDYSKPTVVVTHHSPHKMGVDSTRYKNDDLSHAYYTDLTQFILDKKPLMWIFGHTHKYVKEIVGDTLLYSNPRGYVSDKFDYETEGYSPSNFVEV